MGRVVALGSEGLGKAEGSIQSWERNGSENSPYQLQKSLGGWLAGGVEVCCLAPECNGWKISCVCVDMILLFIFRREKVRKWCLLIYPLSKTLESKPKIIFSNCSKFLLFVTMLWSIL